jgi:hypothetical protein
MIDQRQIEEQIKKSHTTNINGICLTDAFYTFQISPTDPNKILIGKIASMEPPVSMEESPRKSTHG